MSSIFRLKPYIGVTDLDNAEFARMLAGLFPDDFSHCLLQGIMTSYKVLSGIESRWSKVWPRPQDIGRLMARGPTLLPTLHYADYDGVSSKESLVAAWRHCMPHVRALQLDMIWPDPLMLRRLKDCFDIPIILQIGRKAFMAVDDSPSKLLEMLALYKGGIDGVLLDRSGGQGLSMDAAVLRLFVKPLSQDRPDLLIAVAGGLGPDSLSLVRPLVEEFPTISIDAQGQLHENGDSMLPLKWERAYRYVERSIRMFEEVRSAKQLRT